MSAAVQSIEFKASAKKCFSVITNYEAYPEFMKDLKKVTVDKRSDNIAEVTFDLDLIKRITYTLKLVEKAPLRVTWNMLRGDMMKSNTGSWELEEIEKGLTRATYTIDISFGLLMPGAISKMLIGNNLPSMLKAFKNRIEK